MKILIVSHSAVHMRQILFYQTLSRFAEVIVAGPHHWRDLQMNSFSKDNFRYVGLPCVNEGNLVDYTFPDFSEVVEEIKPDLIYAQAEPFSRMANIAFLEAKQRNLPFVIFTWENIRSFQEPAINKLLNQSDGIICGNRDAFKLILTDERKKRMHIIPQVGIDLNYFKPMDIPKTTTVLYVGRKTTEKGINVIVSTCSQLHIELKIISGVDYLELPKIYNEAEVFVSLPIDTPFWKEQSGSYTNIEAMACGIPVITTNCGAIPEYLKEAALYVPQADGKIDVLVFERNLKILQDKEYYQTIREIGLEQSAKYSNEKVAEATFSALSRGF